MQNIAQIIFLLSGLDFTEIKGITIKSSSFTTKCVIYLYLMNFLYQSLLVFILMLDQITYINSAVVVYFVEKSFPLLIHVFLLLKTLRKMNDLNKLHKKLKEIDCDLIELFDGDILIINFKTPSKMLIVNLIILIVTRASMALIIAPLFMLSSALSELIFSLNDMQFKFHLDSLTERIIKLNSFISSSSKLSIRNVLRIRNLTTKMQSHAKNTNDYFSLNVFVTISFNFLSFIISMYWIFMRLVYTKTGSIQSKVIKVFWIFNLLINRLLRLCFLFVSHSTDSMCDGHFHFLYKVFKWSKFQNLKYSKKINLIFKSVF